MNSTNSNSLIDLDEIPTWMLAWSQLMTQNRHHSAEERATAQRVIQQLCMSMQQGNSCLAVAKEDVQALGTLCGQDADHGKASVQQASLYPLIYDQQQHLYLYRYWALEQRLAQHIARLKKQKIEHVDLSIYLDLLQDEYQKQALQMVATQAFSLITGGPGTGKTYTLARIIAVLNQANPNIRIAMAAPTGKAAQRMKEALQNSFNDPALSNLVTDRLQQQETLTLHRLLGMGHQARPRFHARQPLPFDVIVIDEASMLDLQLATLLFDAIPENCRVILLGDAQQLASVDVGSVLADLQQIDALAENRVHLQHSRRFKEGALIGKMAKWIQALDVTMDTAQVLDHFNHRIVQESHLKAIELSKDMADVLQLEYLQADVQLEQLRDYEQKLTLGYQHYFEQLKQYAELTAEDNKYDQKRVDHVIEIFDEYRILTATHHGNLGLKALNAQVEAALLEKCTYFQKQGDWYIGRPVMMIYNDYQLGLSNGDIGICFKHRTQVNEFEVYFPSLEKWIAAARLPKNIQTAFALTIHKSQGSEFKHTAVVLDRLAMRLLSQELIYTAITRAKSVVSLLVDVDALTQALTVKTTRRSGLKLKIENLI